MTDIVDIAALRALLEKATKGPWVISRPEQKGEDWPHGIIVAATARGMGIFASGDSATFPSADRELIAAMRNALPSLLDEIERLREALEDLLPYARTAIGLPENAWHTDSVILKARALLAKVVKP